MIEDNINFTQVELSLERLEIIGTYSINTSLVATKETLRNQEIEAKKEIKEILTEQIKRIVLADALDIPFLKLLYKSEMLRDVVVETLERRVFDIRLNRRPGSPRKDYEDLHLLEELIYKLRIYNFKDEDD